jgi:transposase-like protein
VKAPMAIKYQAGHTLSEVWETTDYFCPRCGKQDVWVEDSPGDYYTGPSHLCKACGADFSLPYGCDARPNNWQDSQRLEALRSAQE